MKILLINTRHSLVGGVERVYFNTGALLEAMGHEVFYFSVLDENTVPNKFTRYFVPSASLREAGLLNRITRSGQYITNKKAYVNLKKLIDEYKPDIAHIHLFCAGLSASILKALKESEIPIVHTVHDYRLVCPANMLLDSKSQICEKCINTNYYQCAVKKCVDDNFFFSTMVALEAYYRKYFVKPFDFIDHFIFVSRFSQLKHAEFNPGYAANSSHLYNFTDLSVEHTPGYATERYYLYFGRLSKEKGITTLLQAFSETGLPLKIAGTGPLYEYAQEFSKNHPNIQVLGYQSGETLNKLIEESYFIILPSECYENNPMTILEGYAYGKPVIGAKIGGIPEIVEEGVTGFHFESRSSQSLVSALKKSRELKDDMYLEMSAKARLFVEKKSSPKLHYENLIAIYNKVISHVKSTKLL